LESDFGREEVEKERVRHVEVRFRSLAYVSGKKKGGTPEYRLRGPMVSRKNKGGTPKYRRKLTVNCTDRW
jgi:hypothetical protein